MDGTTGNPATMSSPAIGAMDGAPPKMKGRQRLLRGIQRIASSPSLPHIGRPRSSSSPYRDRDGGSLSCVSLSSSGASPLSSVSSATSSTIPSSAASSLGQRSELATPLSEVSYFDGFDSPLAVRRAGSVRASPAATTVALPADLKSTRQELGGLSARSASAMPPRKKTNLWADMPHELRVHVFSYLEPKELVRVSRVNKSFYKTSFDGQLWSRLDASAFYRDIPAESLSNIISATAPFIKDLNLRGCVQVEHHKRAEVLVNKCKNLVNATLEGCRNLQRTTLHGVLKGNEKLEYLNLTGLTAVTNATCMIIAENCRQLETFQVSWCKHVDAQGIGAVVAACPRLKDLRASEVKGFDDTGVAEIIFERNSLERLILSGCSDLTDEALQIMAHGVDPEIDILTDLPVVPARKLRHLDLSRCSQLTNRGVQALAHLVPHLEGLQLSGCSALTDAAMERVFESCPLLTHLEIEDLAEITNGLLSEHLANAPCAGRLEHLSISYCANLGDLGVLPVMKNCARLRSVDLNNTRVSDLVLAEAASMVSNRSHRTEDPTLPPRATLHMVVYDCENVTWTGIREVLFRNSQIRFRSAGGGDPTYPTEVVGLKCFYGYQMTVDEHTKRVLRCDLAAAGRLERKWADYMQASEEAGATGAGTRRRRRRAREAQALHADEEEGGGVGQGPRRRARTAPSCTVM